MHVRCGCVQAANATISTEPGEEGTLHVVPQFVGPEFDQLKAMNAVIIGTPTAFSPPTIFANIGG